MRRKLLIATVLAAITWTRVDACTGISLTAMDNASIQARTIEWGNFDLQSKLIVSPRGHGYTAMLPDGQEGLSWTNSLGFVGISVLNLNNYVNLLPGTAAPRGFGEYQARSFGVGTAFRGLPGDISPPSRFVRAAFFVTTAPPMQTAIDAVSQAFHMMHNFDIPLGTEFGAAEREHMPDLPSATQWTAVSDQTNGVFYFTSMHDSAVRKLDLNRIDFTRDTETARPLDQGRFTVQDVTP